MLHPLFFLFCLLAFFPLLAQSPCEEMKNAVVSQHLQTQLAKNQQDNKTPSTWLYRQFAEQGMVLLANKQNLLPIQDLNNSQFSFLYLADTLQTSLEKALQLPQNQANKEKYATICEQTLKLYTSQIAKIDWHLQAKQTKQVKQTKQTKQTKQIANPKIWFVAYFPNSFSTNLATNLTINTGTNLLANLPINLLDSLRQVQFASLDSLAKKQAAGIVLLHFGKAVQLPNYKKYSTISAVLLLHENNAVTQSLAAQAIFGAVSPKGREQGFGLDMPLLGRLKYTIPEEVGIAADSLKQIDSMLVAAIRQQAMPSCQVLVAKNGKVFYHKAFGFHKYDSLQALKLSDLYDLASVTKIAAGTLALMKLVEDQKLDLDKTLADYLPDWKRSNKKNILIREMLAHQAQLPAGIGAWQQTLGKNGKINSKYYSKIASKLFPLQVADSLYAKIDVEKLVLQAIQKIDLLPQKTYLYSDLPFVLSTFLVRKIGKENLATFASKNIYKPLGANSLVFNPLQKYTKQEIVPTEYDSVFRKQQIHGTVHDETAALLGGVSGNAGLFGNANDLAKLMQLYLQQGLYGGKTYFKAETLLEFTRNQYGWERAGNYRGLGFNRPSMNPQPTGHTAIAASEQSFGHSGFTGTYTWADRENGLLFIFLSNRVYPTRENKKLMTLNLRTEILQKIYGWLEE
jgi:CubicO group peptidase (beta-lactamase class C family)